MEQFNKIMAQEGGEDEIYDPDRKCTPKSKLIFKVERHKRATSSCGSSCPARRLSSKGSDCGNMAED